MPRGVPSSAEAPTLASNYSLAFALAPITLLAATLRAGKDAAPNGRGLGLRLDFVQNTFGFSHLELKIRSESKR